MDFTKLINDIKNDKDILKKSAIVAGLFLISFVVTLIIQLLNVSSQFITPFFDEDMTFIVELIMSVVLPMIVQILIFPVYLYLAGYTYKIAKNGKVVEHNDIKDVFRYAFAYFIASFSINLVFGLLLFTIAVIVISLSVVSISSLNWALIVGSIGLVLIVIISLILIISAINSVVIPSMMFVFFKTGRKRDMFNSSLVFSEIKLHGKELLLLIVVNIALNSLSGIVGFILCVLGPLTSAAIGTVRLIINGLLLGQIYSQSKTEI